MATNLGLTFSNGDIIQSYLFNMTRLGNEKKVVLSRYHIIEFDVLEIMFGT